MKKVYTYLAAVAAALVVFSCQTVPHDDSHVDEVVSAPNVAISVSEITDFTATVTIAPEGAANYYAYMIDESDEAEERDPEALYANKYKSVANGLVKYATSGSTTVELEDLKPNTTYQVYAVAGSTTGVVGTVAVKSFLTTDTGTPTPGTPTKKENVLAVAFSEDVTYDATKPATAYYYAYNTAIIDKTDPENPELVFDGKVGEAKVDVTVNGATVIFTVTLDGTNPLPAGAYYTVGYPAGAFVDAVGNPCPIRTHLTGLTPEGNLGFGGFYGRVSTTAFDLEYDKERKVVVPTEEDFEFGMPKGVTFYQFTKIAKATMTVDKSSKTQSSTTTYLLEGGYDWDFKEEDNAVIMYYPDDIEIEGGDYLSFGIGAGSVEDIYGNTNAALSLKYLYSYNYSLKDLYGTYNFHVNWYKNGTFDNEEVMITPRDPFEDPEKEEYYKDRNVAIYNLFKKNPCVETRIDQFVNYNSVHYATFNVHTGFMNIEYEYEGVGLWTEQEWQDYVLILEYDNYGNYNFFQGTAGTLVLQEDLRVYLNGLGTIGYYDAGSTLEKISDEYTVPNEEAAPASVSERAPKNKNVKKVSRNFVER